MLLITRSRLLALSALLVTSFLLSFFMPPTTALRIVFGLPLVLFIPGLIWSYVFFRATSDRRPVDAIERIALAAVLSIVMVPMVVFVLARVGIRITTFTVLVESLLLILIGGTILLWLSPNKSNRGNNPEVS